MANSKKGSKTPEASKIPKRRIGNNTRLANHKSNMKEDKQNWIYFKKEIT